MTVSRASILRPTTATTQDNDVQPSRSASESPFEHVDSTVEWNLHAFSRSSSKGARLPDQHELFVWRLRGEWRLISATDKDRCLTSAERKRMRSYPTSAIGRRFAVARATVRFVLSHVLACAPEDIAIADLADDRIAVVNSRNGRSLAVDIGQSGIWIVIAASAGKLGVGLASPMAGDARSQSANDAQPWDEVFVRACQTSQQRAQRCEFVGEPDATSAVPRRDWHSLELPMPGAIRASVTTQQRIRVVQAFGWQS
ncbi:hypothetical protein [Caballeronia glathei]|uniref:Uncharacterized protein n=1 Tax=Caballeronia glathei TaxID=60547 RepID=A0A069PMT3_9BURK|nr:hypothetical protein [Caballeronia glathei]KDR41747.1 hypothetical protein BG61_15850 [Caballeronia glathei]